MTDAARLPNRTLVAACAILVAGAFLPMVATKPFWIGIRPQSETVSVALSASAAAATWVLLRPRPDPDRRAAILHPIVGLPMLPAAIPAVAAPLQPDPLRVWLGFPAVGEGVLSWLSVALLIAPARLVSAAPDGDKGPCPDGCLYRAGGAGDRGCHRRRV